jgi:threonine/homoserine/homoserine lactone efflux protein
MSTETYVSFVLASMLFGLMPGPSVCFTIAHAVRHGGRMTAHTILGQAAANAVQLLMISVGLASVLERSVVFCLFFKLIGACYLIYLGVRTLCSSAPEIELQAAPPSPATTTPPRAFVDGLVVCGTNPKALFYYAAFLPQFVNPRADAAPQLLVLGAAALSVGILILAGYTVIASWARYWLSERGLWRWHTRASGSLIIAAGAALALADDQ